MHVGHITPWVAVRQRRSTQGEVIAEKLEEPTPLQWKSPARIARNSLLNDGRGSTWDGGSGSTSGCSRTGGTVRMQHFRGTALTLASLQDPAHISENGTINVQTGGEFLCMQHETEPDEGCNTRGCNDNPWRYIFLNLGTGSNDRRRKRRRKQKSL